MAAIEGIDDMREKLLQAVAMDPKCASDMEGFTKLLDSGIFNRPERKAWLGRCLDHIQGVLTEVVDEDETGADDDDDNFVPADDGGSE
jgi:hypothetical protein